MDVLKPWWAMPWITKSSSAKPTRTGSKKCKICWLPNLKVGQVLCKTFGLKGEIRRHNWSAAIDAKGGKRAFAALCIEVCYADAGVLGSRCAKVRLSEPTHKLSFLGAVC